MQIPSILSQSALATQLAVTLCTRVLAHLAPPRSRLGSCFYLHFFLVLPLYLVCIALLFCWMYKLFQIICERRQSINKQDPVIYTWRYFESFQEKVQFKVQDSITGRLQINELCSKTTFVSSALEFRLFFLTKTEL